MDNFTKELVDDLAAKLLFELSNEENKMILDEFAVIDESINKVNEINNIQEVEIMSHCLDESDYILRKDEAQESVNIEDLLANCDRKIDREVVVPKVVN